MFNRTRNIFGFTKPAPIHAFDHLDSSGRILQHREVVSSKRRAAIIWGVAACAELGGALTAPSTARVIAGIGTSALGAYNATQAHYHQAEIDMLVEANANEGSAV